MQPPATRPRGATRHTVLLVVVLAVLWLVFSGKTDVVHLAYGVLSIVLVVLLSRNLVIAHREPVENEYIGRLHWLRVVTYTVWLIAQIIVANVQVTILILRPGPPVKPALIHFRTGMKSSLAKTVLGNSITLTPGTFTLHVREDRFLVHTIHENLAGGLLDGTMPRKVAALFGEDLPDDIEATVVDDPDAVREEVERWSS